ncbi:MAG TPA: methionyl-tRNA formyltransferase, partial [Microbacteriaceae bacterium]|nr:methionyl-tRNA formyltransferase [Microbacteriaceae bacterium]
MRIVFAGTPAVAVPTLEALNRAGHEIVLVLTREDAPRGRKRILTPSEVAVAATDMGLPLLKANVVTDEVVAAVRDARVDLGVVVAFGAIFRPPMLAAPNAGWMNLHFSLLPRWRGAAPVPHALLAGEPLGVSVFQLDTGVDSGPLWRSEALEVDPLASASDVLSDFAVRGAEVVLQAISAADAGESPRPQVGTPSHAPKLAAIDGELRPSDGIAAVFRRFRAMTSEPGAYLWDSDERIK